MYGLTEGQGGTYTIASSFEIRTTLTTTGKNKGKSNGMTKYAEIVSEVVNNIIPLYKAQLDSTGKIPSGKTPAEVLALTKIAYYDSRYALQAASGKMTKEMPVAWTDFAWSSFVLFGPQGKQYAEFCIPTDDDAAPTSRAAAFSSLQSKKRALTESAVSGAAMDRALSDHNNIMVAKFMMKYGNDEDKKLAVITLRRMWDKGKENTPEKTPETSTPSETSGLPESVLQLGPDTGDDVGDDGLTWKQRACKLVYDSKECQDSPNGFTEADVVAKLNGRVVLKDVADATEFLMIEQHIHTTDEDNHYKSIN